MKLTADQQQAVARSSAYQFTQEANEILRTTCNVQLNRRLLAIKDQIQDARKAQRNCGTAERHQSFQKLIGDLECLETDILCQMQANRVKK